MRNLLLFMAVSAGLFQSKVSANILNGIPVKEKA